ncbi:unnamed protein product [Larinioides sclopetarius]|uniref:Uncharacterized protein n=1 Tax=Larinioides sclopetarius TaxID=280406 RepID=A0AAV2API1_9ARAC
MTPPAQNRQILRVYDNTTYEIMPHLIAYEPLTLFVEEIIDYSFRQNNLFNWIPPMNLAYLRLRYPGKQYFDDRIGKAIIHSCIERDAIISALRFRFDENLWLNLNPENARQQLIAHLGLMLMYPRVPVHLAAFQMFSFGCYVGRTAMKRQLNGLVNEVVQALVRTCCVHFPYEQQYIEYLAIAESYNVEHCCTHP